MDDATPKIEGASNDEQEDEKAVVPASKSAAKKPPPESQEAIKTRSFVIASFWAVVIFLGLPVWWWTTSIHRARLPLEQMLEWADGKVGAILANGFFLNTNIIPISGLQTYISSTDNH